MKILNILINNPIDPKKYKVKTYQRPGLSSVYEDLDGELGSEHR